MSGRFIFLALLLLSVCLPSTCEAQLFRRGTARRSNPTNYQQQQYARQYAQANCNNGQSAARSQTRQNLYRLPNGRYAVLRGGRYYYAQPREIQANNRQQQMRRNAYAEQTYGQNANQAARIPSAKNRSNLAVQQPTNAAPTPIRSNVQTAVAPINQPPSRASNVTGGRPYIEGPAIVGPAVVNDEIPAMAPTTQSVIQQVDGALPVGTIPPAADIPTTSEIPVGTSDEKPESFSVLEKSGGDK